MSSVEIEFSDVTKLVGQWLKENKLFRTLKSLQDETQVSLNTVDSVETFVQDINSGNWDLVLKRVKFLKLPDDKVIDLYEQIALELIELQEKRVAEVWTRHTELMAKLLAVSVDRHSHLERLLKTTSFDHKELYGGVSREKRRSKIANALKSEVTVVPSERLLSIIGDALRWRKHEGLLPPGSTIDIFTGKTKIVLAEEETHPNVIHRHCIKPLSSTDDEDSLVFVYCADFSPDGHYLVVGYSTGLIEVRNPTTGRMANDLKYQVQRRYIATPTKTAALSIAFNDNETFAVGDDDGNISVWKLDTGELVQLFESAHNKGITCLVFKSNNKEILTGSLDGTARLHGMRNNRTLLEFRGHRGFVNAAVFSRDENNIITGSSDATVRIWNAKSSHQLFEYKSKASVHSVILMPHFKSDIFLIGTRSRFIQLIDLEGNFRSELDVDATASADEDDDGTKKKNLCAVCLSPRGNWIFTIDPNFLYCYEYSTKKVQKKLWAHDKGMCGVKHHPLLNLISTFDSEGNLKLWRP